MVGDFYVPCLVQNSSDPLHSLTKPPPPLKLKQLKLVDNEFRIRKKSESPCESVKICNTCKENFLATFS